MNESHSSSEIQMIMRATLMAQEEELRRTRELRDKRITAE